MPSNEQPTKELEYFQHVQVLKQQVKTILFEQGVLQSELDEEKDKHKATKSILKKLEWNLRDLRIKLEFVSKTGLILNKRETTKRILQQDRRIQELNKEIEELKATLQSQAQQSPPE